MHTKDARRETEKKRQRKIGTDTDGQTDDQGCLLDLHHCRYVLDNVNRWRTSVNVTNDQNRKTVLTLITLAGSLRFLHFSATVIHP